jgi:hypothetical protein
MLSVKNMTSSGTRMLNPAFMAPPIFSHAPRRRSIDRSVHVHVRISPTISRVGAQRSG